MSLSAAEIVMFLRGIVDDRSKQRADFADGVTDVRTAMDEAQTHCLALVLAALSLWETDGHARESQLHALAELHEWDGTTPDVIHLVSRLDRGTLVGSENEYVAYLLGEPVS